MLMVIDNGPLQAAAWSDLRAARKRLEKATRDLHRHEEIDDPGFRAWLGTTFPQLVTDLREFTQQVAAKSQIVEAVECEVWMSGRSPRAIWREWKRDAASPPETTAPPRDNTDADPFGSWDMDDDDDPMFGDDDTDPWNGTYARREFDAMFEDFCAAQGIDPSDPAARMMREAPADIFGFDLPSGSSNPAANDAREIYRRLVQHLHPDRGGEWTQKRAALWHQVQEAWAARDADMLARLEAEWEIAADTLGPASPVGRLQAALKEIHAARRDAERKVRQYRKTPAWRFSLAPPNARKRKDLQRALENDRAVLRRQLDELEAIIADWERPARKRRKRQRSRPPAPRRHAQFAFDFGGG